VKEKRWRGWGSCAEKGDVDSVKVLDEIVPTHPKRTVVVVVFLFFFFVTIITISFASTIATIAAVSSPTGATVVLGISGGGGVGGCAPFYRGFFFRDPSPNLWGPKRRSGGPVTSPSEEAPGIADLQKTHHTVVVVVGTAPSVAAPFATAAAASTATDTTATLTSSNGLLLLHCRSSRSSRKRELN
jgi:hypothetical protein